MRRIVFGMLLGLTPAILAAPARADDATAHPPPPHKQLTHSQATHKHVAHKKHLRHKSPYGFLPGYEPPEVAEARREREYRESHPYTYYGPAWPRFYRGRWNGGGFGPCYTQTPIGAMWNCGN